MQIQWPLFFWIFRSLHWLTLVSSSLATAYVLLHENPLEFFLDDYAVLFVFAHCFLISRLIGRVRSESFAFLYSQGFTRNLLWGHLWLATLASVLATWVPCAVLILTTLRSQYQDWLQNPWFPVMASTEWRFLTGSLLFYGMLLPLFHYEWIRSATPFRGRVNGHVLAIAYVFFGLVLSQRLRHFDRDLVRNSLFFGFVMISAILGLLGRWLHQRLEVSA
jgi:hypothetical protein